MKDTNESTYIDIAVFVKFREEFKRRLCHVFCGYVSAFLSREDADGSPLPSIEEGVTTDDICLSHAKLWREAESTDSLVWGERRADVFVVHALLMLFTHPLEPPPETECSPSSVYVGRKRPNGFVRPGSRYLGGVWAQALLRFPLRGICFRAVLARQRDVCRSRGSRRLE